VEVSGIFCQAVTQIILMKFQNSCKAPESQGYFCRAGIALPAAVWEGGTDPSTQRFQYKWSKAFHAMSPQGFSSILCYSLAFKIQFCTLQMMAQRYKSRAVLL